MQPFMTEQDGQGLVEYALILVLIAIFLVVALLFMKDRLAYFFGLAGNSI